MTLPAALCLVSICVCLYVALLTLRLSRAPGWKYQRWLAAAAASAAFYIVGDIPVTLSNAPASLVLLATRLQMLGVAMGLTAWLYFSLEALELRRTRLEPAFGAAMGLLSLLCLVPGWGFNNRLPPPVEVAWAGLTYHPAESTLLGDAFFSVGCVGLLVIIARFARAVSQGRREFLWHLIAIIGLVAAAVNDSLITAGLVSNVLLLDVGYMIPIAAAAMGQTASLVQISRDLDKANAALVLALSASKEAGRLKGEFLANISHELRTPLNSIINIPQGLVQYFRKATVARCGGCHESFELEPSDRSEPHLVCPECGPGPAITRAEVTLLELEPEEVCKHLESIERAGEHLLAVVNDILDYSKAEVGEMTIEREPVPVRAFFEGLAQILTPVAAKTGVVLDFDYGGADFVFRADPVKWAQVLINLVSNAVKFSQSGARVEIHAESAEGGCTFRVRDFGVGIAPENHTVIFEAFRQVDGTHTRAVGGTGLGLALAQKLVAMHGGEISLKSALGDGSTFSVWLPATEETGSHATIHPRSSGEAAEAVSR